MLELISMVGVDESTDLQKLVAMDLYFMERMEYQDNPPYNEFGFLYSEARSEAGDPRYPPLKFIKKSMEFLNSGITSTSLHLCGLEAVTRYLSSDSELLEFGYNSRIQLNFSMKNYNEDELIDNLIDVSDKHFMPLIVQCNKSKQEFINKLLKRMRQIEATDGILPNIDLLYDGSGGFGKVIEEIKSPFKNILTGYAGGLCPDNILSILNKIERKIGSEDSDSDCSYYIDMESGIRTDNYFDLYKCQLVLDEVKKFYDFRENNDNGKESN